MGNSGSAHNINSERSGLHRNSHFQTRFEHLNQNSRRQFQWNKSGLRSTSLNPQRSLNPEWRRSYPSTIMKRESNSQLETPLKVLPELDKRLHLRATSNGAILNSGGTISGRKQNENLTQNIPNILSQRSKTFIIENVKDRTSSINEKIDTKPEFTRSQTLLYIKGKIKDSDPNANESNLSRMQRHTYSEPELINKVSSPVTINTQEPPSKPSNRNKYSKKRRAPEVPQANITATPFTQSSKNVLRNAQIANDNAKPMHYAKNSERKLGKQTKSDSLKRDNEISRRSIKETSFQGNSAECSRIPFRREKSSDAILLRNRKPDQADASKNTALRNGYQIKNPIIEPISAPVVKNLTPKEKLENGVSVQDKVCQRTFYFGMELDSPVEVTQSSNTADEQLLSENKSLSMISSYDIEYKETTRLEESLNDNGLLVRIRPTLPRRQVETPSFSPTLAWRSLLEQQDCIDKLKILKTINHNHSTMPTSETPIQPNRTLQIRQLSRPNHLLTTWTPEQDLGDEHDDKLKGLSTEDDTSSDEYRSKCEEDGLLFYGSKKKTLSHDKVAPIHTFSLSLPRDSHIQHTRSSGNFNTGEVCIYKSLQKSKPENYLKVNDPSSYNQRNSSSQAQLENICVTNFECSNNWMLHKNMSSTELYTKSLEHGKRQRLVTVEPQSIKFLTGGKHVMYLPGSSDQPNPSKAHQTEPQDNLLPAKTSRHFKSRQRHMPQSLQDKTPIFPIKSYNEEVAKLDDDKPFHQRFLFNNPVRLLEKKLHADKTVKPAKLKMSLDGQLEALKKVEEDFQRNRANEKENIQHQLRLYFGTDDEQYHSLPIAPVLDRFAAINLNDTDSKLYRRDDPDGCVSNVVLENEDQTITFASKNILT